jgi:hypothetical protein
LELSVRVAFFGLVLADLAIRPTQAVTAGVATPLPVRRLPEAMEYPCPRTVTLNGEGTLTGPANALDAKARRSIAESMATSNGRDTLRQRMNDLRVE